MSGDQVVPLNPDQSPTVPSRDGLTWTPERGQNMAHPSWAVIGRVPGSEARMFVIRITLAPIGQSRDLAMDIADFLNGIRPEQAHTPTSEESR